MCRRRGLKVIANNRWMGMGHDWSKCQSSNIWGVLDESGTDNAKCHRKVASGRKVNARNLQLEYAKMLHETLLMPVLLYGSETLIWREEGCARWKTSDVCFSFTVAHFLA